LSCLLFSIKTKQKKKTKQSGVSIEERTSVSANQFGQLQQAATAPFGPTTFIFGSNSNYAESDSIAWFSQLKSRNQADGVISFIREEFPFVLDIEMLAPDNHPGLYAALADGTRRQLTTVSSGIYKILSILLSTAHTHDGITRNTTQYGAFYINSPKKRVIKFLLRHTAPNA
jgi:hypothetical protein